MNQSSELVNRHAKMLDETVSRVVMSMPDKTVDVVELRSELAKALHEGSTTLFHLFRIGRDLAARTAEPVVQKPELFETAVTGDSLLFVGPVAVIDSRPPNGFQVL